MTKASDLIYPLRWEQDRIYKLLLEKFGPRYGRSLITAQLADTIQSLQNAEGHARAMTPFDPSGL